MYDSTSRSSTIAVNQLCRNRCKAEDQRRVTTSSDLRATTYHTHDCKGEDTGDQILA